MHMINLFFFLLMVYWGTPSDLCAASRTSTSSIVRIEEALKRNEIPKILLEISTPEFVQDCYKLDKDNEAGRPILQAFITQTNTKLRQTAALGYSGAGLASISNLVSALNDLPRRIQSSESPSDISAWWVSVPKAFDIHLAPSSSVKAAHSDLSSSVGAEGEEKEKKRASIHPITDHTPIWSEELRVAGAGAVDKVSAMWRRICQIEVTTDLDIYTRIVQESLRQTTDVTTALNDSVIAAVQARRAFLNERVRLAAAAELLKETKEIVSPYYQARQITGYTGIPAHKFKFSKSPKPLLLKLSAIRPDGSPRTIYILGTSHNLPLSSLDPKGIKTLKWLAEAQRVRLVTEHDSYNWFVDKSPTEAKAESSSRDDEEIWSSILPDIQDWITKNSNTKLYKAVGVLSEWDVKSIGVLRPIERILAIHHHEALSTRPLYGGMDFDLECAFPWHSIHRLETNAETTAQFYQEWKATKDNRVLNSSVTRAVQRLEILAEEDMGEEDLGEEGGDTSMFKHMNKLASSALDDYTTANMIAPRKPPESVIERNELWAKKIATDVLSSADDSHPPLIVCGFMHMSGGSKMSLVGKIAEHLQMGSLDIWTNFTTGSEPTWGTMARSFGITLPPAKR